MTEQYSSGASGAAGIFILLVTLVIGLAVTVGVCAIIAYIVSENYKAIPQQYRKMEPQKVWLLLIPIFNLYWNFPVFLGLADSYKAAFDSKGVLDVGDCGRQLALFWCIAAIAANIPYVGCIGLPAAIVLLILFLVKAADLKKRLLIPPPMGI